MLFEGVQQGFPSLMPGFGVSQGGYGWQALVRGFSKTKDGEKIEDWQGRERTGMQAVGKAIFGINTFQGNSEKSKQLKKGGYFTAIKSLKSQLRALELRRTTMSKGEYEKRREDIVSDIKKIAEEGKAENAK